MQEDWDYYLCEIDGEQAGVFINLALHGHAPDVERRVSLRIATPLIAAEPGGLEESDETDADRLEDDLEETVLARMNALYVGRITHSGLREFFFYASGSQGMLEAVREVSRRHPEYKLEAGSAADPRWDQYLQVMYPAPEVLRSMNKQKVLNALREHGDELTQPREVEHWVHFASTEARHEFRKKVAGKGFAVRRELNDPNEESVERPFGLIIWRKETLDQQNIDRVTLELEALSQASGGHYECWESPVIA